MYAYFDSPSCPDGWIPANGSSGTRDVRGRFIRSADMGANIDKDRYVRGHGVGTRQGDAIRNIEGRFATRMHETGNRVIMYRSGAFSSEGYGSNTQTSALGSGGGNRLPEYTSFDASRVVPTGADNRPLNIALLVCVHQG